MLAVEPGAFGARFEIEGVHVSGDQPVGEPRQAASPPPETLSQLVHALRMQVREGGGDAVLQLNPQQFGNLSISLRVHDGAVTATIAADVPAVGEWLESQEALLRQGLEEIGLRLEELIVERDPEERRERQEAPPERRGRQKRTAEASTFEITV
jgi:flagellar hook-length control protein FliK